MSRTLSAYINGMPYAYLHTILDSTYQLTEGIKQLAKKNMHDVSNAINILDSSKEIDGKICKEKYKHSGTAEAEGKCGLVGSSGEGSTGLSALWEPNTSDGKGGGYEKTSTEKMGGHTSATISKDTAALTREQKGVVSSAFAKAHEGA